MKVSFHKTKGRGCMGMTLVEMMVAVGLGSLVLAVVATVFVSSLTNFAGLGNYAELTGQSRMSLDLISREIRESSQVIAFNTNLPVRSLTLTNAMKGSIVKVSWDSTTGNVTLEKSGEPPRICLTGCEQWDFTFFQRSPRVKWTFYSTPDHRLCKLINMSWKCSRPVLNRVNTETIVTAQVVLRNK